MFRNRTKYLSINAYNPKKSGPNGHQVTFWTQAAAAAVSQAPPRPAVCGWGCSSPRCQTSPSEHRRNQLRTFPKPALKCGPARVEGPLRRAQTPWPWRTDRARGPAAHGAKRHLLNTVETSFEPSLNQP